MCLTIALLQLLLEDGLLCLLLRLTWGQGHLLVHDWLLKGPPPHLASGKHPAQLTAAVAGKNGAGAHNRHQRAPDFRMIIYEFFVTEVKPLDGSQ